MHALDENQNVGLILLDLSKAFDCLPHRLLLGKLWAYGVSYESCKLIKSYLCNRLQRVMVASMRSEWAVMPKGVPQGSVLGPLLFNIFLNDIFYSFKNVCSLYNYADDNTISCYSHDMNVLKEQLEANAKVKTTGFGLNTFCYQGAKIWNAVPENIKNAESISTCKELIAQWSGPECTYGSCLLCNTYVIWLPISLVVLYRLLLFCSLSNKEFCLIIISV